MVFLRKTLEEGWGCSGNKVMAPSLTLNLLAVADLGQEGQSPLILGENEEMTEG